MDYSYPFYNRKRQRRLEREELQALNSIRAGIEWRPFHEYRLERELRYALELMYRRDMEGSIEWFIFRGSYEGSLKLRSRFDDVIEAVLSLLEAAGRVRNDDVREASHVIEDPLAFYVPYHYCRAGIYLRINKMVSDFRDFIHKYSKYLRWLSIESLWYMYVITIFWHEMAHHVIEDVATARELITGYSHYPLMHHPSPEEGFCEFYAFTTAEEHPCPLPSSIDSLSPILLSASVPEEVKDRLVRKMILSLLYYHWNRNNDTTYRPRIDSDAARAVDGLWRGFWEAHRKGCTVIRAPDEIYRNIYYVTI